MGSNIFDVLNTGWITVGILCSVQDTVILEKTLTDCSARSLEMVWKTEEVGPCSLEKTNGNQSTCPQLFTRLPLKRVGTLVYCSRKQK